MRLNIRAMADLVVPYPTYMEVGKRAAISFFAPKLSTSLGAAPCRDLEGASGESRQAVVQ